jgi:1-acyl-sn-glycerol-3-phosphate acyltransferase
MRLQTRGGRVAFRVGAEMMHLFLQRASPIYARWLARRFLDGVYVRNLDAVAALVREESVILAGNHVCWWDGQLLLVVQRALGVQGRFLVNQTSIDRLSFIGGIGGIGVDRSTISATLASLERAAAWVTAERRALWIFPQGRYRPQSVRPLGLQRGVRVLARLSDVPVVPVALSYNYLDQHLPAVVISFGEPIRGQDKLVERLEAALQQELDAQQAWFDDPERPPLPALVPSAVVPFEEGFGARFYLFWSRLFRSARQAFGGLGRSTP